MYKKVSTDMNFVDREKETEKFWEDNHIFKKSIYERKEGEVYTFYDGPPTANGKPHIGHVLTRVIKDMIPRYRTMKGYMVPRKAGWDTHGLPVELEVEKLLGLDGKDQIEEYGLEPFIDNQRFEGAAFALSHISLYFTCMANGNSKMYNEADMREIIEKSGLKLKTAYHGIGKYDYTLLECVKK